MPANKNNNNRLGPNNNMKRQSHVFRGVRDMLTNDGSDSSSLSYTISTDANGAATAAFGLAPLGIKSVIATATGSTVSWTSTVTSPPRLPWLWNQARNFERYRVTRAVLCFIGNVGSTTTGRILLDSSTDYADLTTPQTLGLGAGGRMFDLASSASKELRFQMDVDTSWKKVSASTVLTSTSNSIIPVNSVNDLIFSAGFVTIVGGPGTQLVGNLVLEYDVEFRDPIAYGANN